MKNVKYDLKRKACCFTGHRSLMKDKSENLMTRLNLEIDKLIELGVSTYYSGGALGFDQISASIIIKKRDEGRSIELIFALPHKNQDELWSSEQKVLYKSLLDKAYKIIYISDAFDKDCMKKRNYYMVEHSSYCICALEYKRSGTFQTVRYAQKNGLNIVNVANVELRSLL